MGKLQNKLFMNKKENSNRDSKELEKEKGDSCSNRK